MLIMFYFLICVISKDINVHWNKTKIENEIFFLKKKKKEQKKTTLLKFNNA